MMLAFLLKFLRDRGCRCVAFDSDLFDFRANPLLLSFLHSYVFGAFKMAKIIENKKLYVF